QIARLGPHLAKIISELIGVLFAHLVSELLKLPLGARAGGERLGSFALAGSLRGALDIFASLFQLLAFISHAGLIFGPVHALANFVNIGEHLLLFLLQPLQAAANFFPLLLGARLLQRRLKFFES